MRYPEILSFRQASAFGFVKPWRSRKYLDWVKSQPCCVCMRPGDDPHHIQMPGKGMGGKHPDWATIPLCRECHDELHAKGWDINNISQTELVMWTLGKAISEGVFKEDV